MRKERQSKSGKNKPNNSSSDVLIDPQNSTKIMAVNNTVDITSLPTDVREKLAELELELSEGKTLFN